MLDWAGHWQRLPHSLVAAKTVAAGLAVIALCLLAKLLVVVISDAQLPVVLPSPADAPRISTGSSTPLAQWHLFGLPSNAAAPSNETALALVLRGTIASSDPRSGTAFISDAQGHDARYRVGASLPGGVVLDAVYAGRVILLNNGQRETLSLRGVSSAATTQKSAPASPDGGFLTGVLGTGAPDLQTQREQREPDLQILAEQANVLPVLENGRVIGVQVRVPDPALLERVGLQPDDIITSVNGIALNDPAVAPALQNQLRAGGLLTLTVRRDGHDLTLSLGL